MLRVTMTTFLALSLVLLGAHGVAAVTHSMTYIVTAARGVDGFPEHNEVGLVDGQEFVHYDSNLKKIVPKTDWIEKNTDADYWERETQRNINTQQVFKRNIATVMARFNQTSGAHIVQRMYGCEWNDETDKINVFFQDGYDGEDFIAFDLATETWIAPKPQAVITKHKWDKNKANNDYWKNYLTQTCVDWLKKYLNYEKSSLMRTGHHSKVSLLQKTSSSPVSCHATGFYPDRADLFWRKDGEEFHEGRGEILPNNDGSFQMSVVLDLSSVKPEDWGKYECVFQLSGVKDDIITKLDKAVIRSNEKKSTDMTIIIVVAVVVVALIVIAVVGFMVYKKKKEGEAKVLNNSSENSSELSAKLNPEP